MMFRDRADAGRQLARRLSDLAGSPKLIVLGLPRGGLPVAHEVASALRAPLDVFVVRKLGVPGHEELAMGAIASGGARVLNSDVIATYGITTRDIERVAAIESAELERRNRSYREGAPFADLRGATVVLVDDGIATGATMQVAIAAVRKLQASRVVVAVPVLSRDALRDLSISADGCYYVAAPEPFWSVGSYYDDFGQTSDAEVRGLLGPGLRRPA